MLKKNRRPAARVAVAIAMVDDACVDEGRDMGDADSAQQKDGLVKTSLSFCSIVFVVS